MTSDRQKQVDRFYRAGTVGTFALMMLVPASIGMEIFFESDLASSVDMTVTAAFLILGLIALVLLAFFALMWALGTMFFRRASDEFTLANWNSGTNAAFFAVIAWLLFGTVIQAFIDSVLVVSNPLREDPISTVVTDWALIVTLGAFFIGYHFNRRKSGS